ncbi:hypothetical protein GCM10009811_15960 [Nostocoides veronense]|uniref:DUF6318 domain-containing protein n=1 Tax=Nostocoides veronense TaxID=330836 RepID=A0ABP4XXM0_9MICO
MAFVEYYWAATNYALTKPDPDLLVGLSAPSCDACEATVTGARELVADNHRYTNSTLTVESTEFIFNSKGSAAILTRVDFLPTTVVDEKGKVLQSLPRELATRVVNLKWTDQWQVDSVAAG